jgi:hypothetical protein
MVQGMAAGVCTSLAANYNPVTTTNIEQVTVTDGDLFACVDGGIAMMYGSQGEAGEGSQGTLSVDGNP